MIIIAGVIIVGLIAYGVWVFSYLFSGDYKTDERLRRIGNYEL